MPKVSPDYLAARRDHVLTAAAARFARQGFHRTSMQDVIDEAGLSPGAVYRYFRSKDEIILAISRDAMALVEIAVREGLDTGRTLPELLARLPGVLACLDRADDRMRLAVQAWGEALRSPTIAEAMRDGLAGVRDALADRIRAGQHDGDVDHAVNPGASADVLLAVLQGFILQRSWNSDLDPKSYGRAAATLARGLQPHTARASTIMTRR